MSSFHDRKARKRERAFYEDTQKRAGMGRRDLKQPTSKKTKTQASPKWFYQIPAILIPIGVLLVAVLGVQYVLMTLHNLTLDAAAKTGFFHNYGAAWLYLLLTFVAFPIGTAYSWKQWMAIWGNNNSEFVDEFFEPYANDAYVRTPDHIIREFDAAPDAGLGFDGHVSSLVGHMMVSNKGIKEIDMPVLDPDREGQVAVDENGNVITKKMKMFDKDFAMELYKFSNVAMKDQHWIDATDYAFNEKNSKKEAKHGNARKGAFGRKAYDTLADYINGEFYPLPTDTQRPAGVYFYDSRPVNTILIAITRGGKGLRYKFARLVG